MSAVPAADRDAVPRDGATSDAPTNGDHSGTETSPDADSADGAEATLAADPSAAAAASADLADFAPESPPPPPNPVRARLYQPTAPPVETDRTFGIEYIVFGIVLTVLVFLVSERAQRLLHYLYDPILMAILGVVFVEYVLLKARDRTYVLEREIELHRRKRDELRTQIDEVRAEIAALAILADGRMRDRRRAEQARAELTERLRHLHERLDERP